MSFKVINSLTAFEAAILCAALNVHIEVLIEGKLIECPAQWAWDDAEISKLMPRARRFVAENLDTNDAHQREKNLAGYCPELFPIYLDWALVQNATQASENNPETPTGWLCYEGWVNLEQDAGAIGYGRRTRAQDALEFWGKRANKLARLSGCKHGLSRFAGRI